MRKTFFLISFVLYGSVVFSQTEKGEATLKAAFIYNFTKYIDWKPEDMQAEFVIGVIGNSPVTASLEEISKTYRAKNRRIVIRYYNKPEEIVFCNILFIPKSQPHSLFSILEQTRKGMLTITEEPGFGNLGSAINFINVRNKLKFEANLDAIYSAGLSASSQLLKLAVIVGK